MISEEKRQAVLAHLAAGMDAGAIATLVNVSRTTVRRLRDGAGLPVVSQRQRVLRLLKEGRLTHKEIAAEVGCRLSVVKKLIATARQRPPACRTGCCGECVACAARAYSGPRAEVDDSGPLPGDPTPDELESLGPGSGARHNRPVEDPTPGIRQYDYRDLVDVMQNTT